MILHPPRLEASGLRDHKALLRRHSREMRLGSCEDVGLDDELLTLSVVGIESRRRDERLLKRRLHHLRVLALDGVRLVLPRSRDALASYSDGCFVLGHSDWIA